MGRQSGNVVMVGFLGLNSFSGVRMPANGDITPGNYIMNTAEPVLDFDVWKVEHAVKGRSTCCSGFLQSSADFPGPGHNAR